MSSLYFSQHSRVSAGAIIEAGHADLWLRLSRLEIRCQTSLTSASLLRQGAGTTKILIRGALKVTGKYNGVGSNHSNQVHRLLTINKGFIKAHYAC